MARWDASVQQLGLAEVCVEIEGRLLLCAGCRAQLLLCSRCDRGKRYCDRACWRRVHDAARREAADRYQRYTEADLRTPRAPGAGASAASSAHRM